MDKEACYQEARRLFELSQRNKECFSLCEKAVELGHPLAKFLLAVLLHEGQGVQSDKEKAKILFEAAVDEVKDLADKGDLDAQVCFGKCLKNGYGVTKNETGAFELFKVAAATNFPAAQVEVGLCYVFGNGVAKDEDKAVEWYRKAADQGNSIAQLRLGLCYLWGNGVEKDESKAMKWLQIAADQGNAEAQWGLGSCYHYGQCVTKDEDKAVEWYRKAADQGNAEAQWRLGLCYLGGQGVAIDLYEAARLVHSASSVGLLAAVDFLASNRNQSSMDGFFEALRRVMQEKRDSQERLHRAVESKDYDVLRALMKSNPELLFHLHELSGQSPLHLAASRGDEKAVEILLEVEKMPVNFLSRSGRTALHEAAFLGNEEVAAFLLKRNADINARTYSSETALFLACKNGKFSLAQLLVSKGADVTIKNQDGHTALEVLLEKKEVEWAQKLQEMVDQQDAEQELSRALGEWRGKHKIELLNSVGKASDENEKTARKKVRNALKKLRSFQPTKEQFFMDKWNSKEDALFRALAYSTVDVSSPVDVSTALQEYERLSGPKSPLLLLAHAKLAEKQGSKTLMLALLREFRKHVGEDVARKWCSEDLLKEPSLSSKVNKREDESALGNEHKELSKHVNDQQRRPLDELMSMVGLEEVKRAAMQLYSEMLADKRLRDNGVQEAVFPKSLNFMFVGNPGTGKTLSANLFAKLLEQSGVRAACRHLKITAGEALRKGARQFAAEVGLLTGGGRIEEGATEDRVKPAREKPNAILFIDEAHNLNPENNFEGRAIFNEIMSVADECRYTVTVILAAYKDEIENSLWKVNPVMASRFRVVRFSDFTESQLADIWRKYCKEARYECDEDVTVVAARRLARGRGRNGFGNAHDVRKMFEASASLAKMRFKDKDKMPRILMEDVIGKRPNRQTIPELDEALQELERIIGLESVKASVTQLLVTAEANYDKELRGEAIDLLTLNRLFIGNPGTGKTTVAMIYGKILKALRFLSVGDMIQKVASDFVGDKVGESQAKTRAILKAAEGKVLFIDEAYALDDNMFGKQVLDTIVEKVQATAGADVAVIMAGYKEPMLKMLRDQNPGLSSRFDPKFALTFADYNDEELLQILSKEVAKGKIHMPMHVKLHAVKELAKRRALPNFGNARAVHTLLSNTKTRRLARQPHAEVDFILADVDPDLEVLDPQNALLELKSFGKVAETFEEIALCVEQMRKGGLLLDGLVNHFVFTGGPGTGKSTVGRLIARVLFSLGITATKDVVETSAQELIGAYVGHTRKAVQEKMQQARGGVLLIDEAYYLGEGSFGNEALGQLLSNLTLPEFMNGKTVVVLAGYKDKMHDMFGRNPGLKSRFTTFVHFEDMSPQKCVEVVESVIKAKRCSFDEPEECKVKLCNAFSDLQHCAGWANGRDAVEMSNKILRHLMLRIARERGYQGNGWHVTAADVQAAIEEFRLIRCQSLEEAPAADSNLILIVAK